MADDGMIGRTLADRYFLEAAVGRGGMATVYRGWDSKLGRFVAIKVFDPAVASGTARRDSEVRLLARMNHPNLVTLHDAHLAEPGSDEPSFLVMEFVEGADLGTRMASGPLSEAEASGYLADVAEALVAIHAAQIVHRDIKPGNILLAPTGLAAPELRAKLADFGIAHLVGTDPLTTVGTVIGTAAYLSPEQAAGQEATAASDVYSLGLVTIEALTGVRAFPGSMAEALAARVVRDPDVPPDASAQLRGLLASMTARTPGDRPSATEVVDAVRGIPGPSTSAAGATVGSGVDDPAPTERMLPPTLVLPVASESATVASSAPDEPARRSRRGLVVALAGVVAALVIVGAIVAGLVASLGHGPTAVNTPAPTKSATTVTSTVPPSPSAAPTPSVTPTPPDDQGGPGDNGNGQGNRNGNGPGNNGNGNGPGKGHKHKP